MAMVKLGRGQQRAEGGGWAGRAGWGWSARGAVHSGSAVAAAAGEAGNGIAGGDAGVSFVQGASRGLGLEFVSVSHLHFPAQFYLAEFPPTCSLVWNIR